MEQSEEEELYVIKHLKWIKKPDLYTKNAKIIAEKEIR